MRIIGITGGVGAGKSEILEYLKEQYSCEIVKADEVAHEVKEPGSACYRELLLLLGEAVLDPSGQIDKKRMADRIFRDPRLLTKVNQIIHPAVKARILSKLEYYRMEGRITYLF